MARGSRHARGGTVPVRLAIAVVTGVWAAQVLAQSETAERAPFTSAVTPPVMAPDTAPVTAPAAAPAASATARPARLPGPPPPIPGGLAVAPVVVELYTAQGCSACPPADAMLASLAGRADVIALALHVDYWDYIGWADVFAAPEHGERQIRYARAHGLGTIYTPQVVINGTELIEGVRVMEIMEAIEAHLRIAPPVWLSLTRVGPEAVILHGAPLSAPEAEPGPLLASRGLTLSGVAEAGTLGSPSAAGPVPHEVQMVRYRPHARVEITAGENAGLTGDYVNIVTSWQTVGTWDLQGELALSLAAPGDEPVVVLVQEPGQGAIIAAARLD